MGGFAQNLGINRRRCRLYFFNLGWVINYSRGTLNDCKRSCGGLIFWDQAPVNDFIGTVSLREPFVAFFEMLVFQLPEN